MKHETLVKMDSAKKHLKHFDYRLANQQGVIDRTICKICGVLLTSLIPMEEGSFHEKKDGHTIVYQPVVSMPTREYVVIEIEMKDGSKHQTPICKQCAKTLKADDLEAIYFSDLNRLQKNGMDIDNLVSRVPMRYTILNG